jgi:ABC-type lipoprotein export system ATPase subunit
VELVSDELVERVAAPPPARLDPDEKRFGAEVALDRVTKAYGRGDEPVVADLTWSFAPERVHVLAGPSGSGKTTLLNLMAGLEHPDAGEVWLGGERIDSLGPDESARWRRRSVGYLSQHSTLAEFLTARENVQLALTLRGLGEEEAARRADRWLEWVGLAKLAGRRADRLSGGEQRRIGLARALAPGPRVLLADEPTAHLDRVTGRMIIKLLKTAAQEAGTTVIAASHDPDLVSAADARLVLGSVEAPVPQPDPARLRRRDAG